MGEVKPEKQATQDENISPTPEPVKEVAPAQPSKTEIAALSASVIPVSAIENTPVAPDVTNDPAKVAGAISGDNATKEALLDVYEKTDFTMPTGPAKYMFIAEGIGKAMEDNPDLKKSQMLQLGYMLCLFFGKLGGFNADADSYSSFVSAIHRDERMSKEELQHHFEVKEKNNNMVLLQDSYLKCKTELAKTVEESNKHPEDEDLKYTIKFLEEKQKEYEKKFKDAGINIATITRDSVKLGLSGLTPTYEKGLDLNDEKNKKIKEDKKVDFVDSMLSVQYVVNMLGISEVKENDPDRLYAKLFNSRYSRGKETDKPKSPYLHLRDAGSFIKRAENETLAVNTVVFFSQGSTDEGKSFMMAGIVCPDNKIRYQNEEGIKTFDFVADDQDSKNDINRYLGVGFKGAFEPEDSKYNEDIITRIEDAKAKEDEAAAAETVTTTETTAKEGAVEQTTPPPSTK